MGGALFDGTGAGATRERVEENHHLAPVVQAVESLNFRLHTALLNLPWYPTQRRLRRSARVSYWYLPSIFFGTGTTFTVPMPYFKTKSITLTVSPVPTSYTPDGGLLMIIHLATATQSSTWTKSRPAFGAHTSLSPLLRRCIRLA